MPRLPAIWDPSQAVDKLPQPYRMIDKLLSEIVERAVEVCKEKEAAKRLEKLTRVDLNFTSHATILASGFTTCFCAAGIAGIAMVGCSTGEVYTHSARDPNQISADPAHPSAVTAIDVGHLVVSGCKLTASVSQQCLCLHEVNIKTNELKSCAMVQLPSDPDNTDAPCAVRVSQNSHHIAVCYKSGTLLIYEMSMPPEYYEVSTDLLTKKEADQNASQGKAEGAPLAPALKPATPPTEAPPGPPPIIQATPATQGPQASVKLVVQFTVAAAQASLAAGILGESNVVWQLQQRPDKSGKSDRDHKPARGAYLWWHGCNELLLCSFQPTPAAPVSHAVKSWLLPHGITAACSTGDSMQMAFGLVDGTVIVWDDQFGGHTKILPRLPTLITALAYANHQPFRLVSASKDGTVHMADLVKPEESYSAPAKLPLPATQVYFLSQDPFCLLLCPGDHSQGVQPRLMWFSLDQQKLVGECIAKTDNGFGLAGLKQHSIPLPPNPAAAAAAAVATPQAKPVTPPPAGKAGKGAAQAPPPPVEAPPPPPPPPITAYPMWSVKDTYLIVGGHLSKSINYRGDDDAPPEAIPQDSQLLLYKVDALVRYLLPPEEVSSKASKKMLERMLADLDPPRKKKGRRASFNTPDPDAPKPPPSAMKKQQASDSEVDDSDAGSEAETEARTSASGRPSSAGSDKTAVSMAESSKARRISFTQDSALFEDDGVPSAETKKQFKKETVKGGYSERRRPSDSGSDINFMNMPGKGNPNEQFANPDNMQPWDRPTSPPWHHTNPTARIHPDWEEAPVLTRIMERISSKGGGRKRRDKRIKQVMQEVSAKYSKDMGPKNLQPA